MIAHDDSRAIFRLDNSFIVNMNNILAIRMIIQWSPLFKKKTRDKTKMENAATRADSRVILIRTRLRVVTGWRLPSIRISMYHVMHDLDEMLWVFYF